MLGKGGQGLGCTVRDETRENQGHRQDLGTRFNTIDFYIQMGGVCILYTGSWQGTHGQIPAMDRSRAPGAMVVTDKVE